jgi:hypothetical protein
MRPNMGGGLGSRSRRRASALGCLLVAALVLGAGTGGAVTVEEPATVTREAYFTNPLTQITPPLLRNGFPPATVCLVAGLVGVAQLCGTEIQQLVSVLGLTDGLPIPVTPDGDLAQLVLPGTTPVGMLGGQQRYASLYQVALPTVPEGEAISRFELVLKQDGLSFALESPALRDIVLQVVSQLSEQDPAKITDAVQRAILGEVPLVTEMITGIEACPIIEPWQGGSAQGAALDGTRLPDVDCLNGTTGRYDAASNTWTFDLTFAAQAWTEGDADGEVLANEGVLLRPVGAPNLAYGDPDLSTNWVVSLGNGEAGAGTRPMIRYSTVPADVGAPVPSPGGGGTFQPPTFAPGAPIDFGGVSTPPVASAAGPLTARFAEREPFDGKGHTPGWVWLALPLGAIGALIFAQSLGASTVANRRRPGALSHLVAAHEHDGPDPRSPGAAP